MQPKRSPLLLATAALGVLALGGLAYIFLPGGGQTPAPNPKGGRPVATPTPVPNVRWIAARDIPPRTRITRDMLAQAAIAGDVPPGAIKDLSDVQGELTNDPIARGETVTLTSFTPGLKRAVPANIEVPRGFRAVAIYVDPNSTAAGLVDVGDYVDVIAVHKLTVDKEKNQFVQGALQFSAGRLIGSDLKVLAVDKSLAAPTPTPATTPAAGAAGAAPASAPPPAPPAPPPPNVPAPKIRVILAAPVDTATRLVAAGDQGTLHITIRNPIDGDQTLSPEAREYPSRVVTQREVKTAGQQIGKAMGDGFRSSLGIGSGGSRRLRDDAPPLPAMNPTPPLPLSSFNTAMPQTAPAPLPPMGSTTPSLVPSVGSVPPVPKTRDITVIRGTEKTLVIVPAR
jgi:Flp pilus assembly protein CpaB